MVKSALICAAALLTVVGCSNKNVDSMEAVKQGVIRDIAKNINVGAMDVNVVSVSFRDKEADAVVQFVPKGGTPAQGLTMNYTMERQGSDWHIKKRAQSDLQKHAGAGGRCHAGWRRHAGRRSATASRASGHGQRGDGRWFDGWRGDGRWYEQSHAHNRRPEANLPPGHPPLGDSAK